jgi:hypothetical protein
VEIVVSDLKLTKKKRKKVKAIPHLCDSEKSITQIFSSLTLASPPLFSPSPAALEGPAGEGRQARQWGWRQTVPGLSDGGGGRARSRWRSRDRSPELEKKAPTGGWREEGGYRGCGKVAPRLRNSSETLPRHGGVVGSGGLREGEDEQ